MRAIYIFYKIDSLSTLTRWLQILIKSLGMYTPVDSQHDNFTAVWNCTCMGFMLMQFDES